MDSAVKAVFNSTLSQVVSLKKSPASGRFLPRAALADQSVDHVGGTPIDAQLPERSHLATPHSPDVLGPDDNVDNVVVVLQLRSHGKEDGLVGLDDLGRAAQQESDLRIWGSHCHAARARASGRISMIGSGVQLFWTCESWSRNASTVLATFMLDDPMPMHLAIISSATPAYVVALMVAGLPKAYVARRGITSNEGEARDSAGQIALGQGIPLKQSPSPRTRSTSRASSIMPIETRGHSGQPGWIAGQVSGSQSVE